MVTTCSNSDEELLRLLEEALEETRGCIGEDDARRLYECGLTGEGEVEVTVEGLRVTIPCADLPEAWFNLSHVFCTRDYARVEGFEPRPGWVVVDAGAYLGFYTLFAARRVGGEGLVVAVEPLEANRRYIEHNVSVNGFEDRVRVDPRALSDRRGYEYITVSCYPATSSLIEAHVVRLGGEACGRRLVAVTTLPALIEEHGLSRVDLLKLDVEGVEDRVLSVSGWEDVVKRLVVEVHLDVTPLGRVEAILEDRGFKTRVVEIGSDTQLMLYAWR